MKILSILAVSAVLITGCSSPGNDQAPSNSDSNQEAVISLGELAQHNSADDCWMAIEGLVYDVTSYVSSHPGEEQILLGCGKDATSLFNTKANQGIPHSSNADRIKAGLVIGRLSD